MGSERANLKRPRTDDLFSKRGRRDKDEDTADSGSLTGGAPTTSKDLPHHDP